MKLLTFSCFVGRYTYSGAFHICHDIDSYRENLLCFVRISENLLMRL